VDCNEGSKRDPLEAPFPIALSGPFKNLIFVTLNRTFEFPVDAPLLAVEIRERGAITQALIKWRLMDPELGSSFGAVAIGSQAVFAIGIRGVLLALEPETGRRLWESDLGAPASKLGSPYVHAGNVFLCTENEVIVFRDSRSKSCVGRFQLGLAALPTTPAADDSHLYLSTTGFLWALRLP